MICGEWGVQAVCIHLHKAALRAQFGVNGSSFYKPLKKKLIVPASTSNKQAMSQHIILHEQVLSWLGMPSDPSQGCHTWGE